MTSNETTQQPGVGNKIPHAFKAWSSLQTRMTMSYVWVTIILGLVFVCLAGLVFAFIASTFIAPFVYTLTARDVAVRYAFAATLQTQATGLNPQITFLPHQPGSLILPGSDSFQIPYINTVQPDTSSPAFVVLITSTGRVLATSYPKHYPINSSATVVLPEQAKLITNALAGTPTTGISSNNVYAIETVWSQNRLPIGAIYVQLPGAPSLMDTQARQQWKMLVPATLLAIVILLIIISPIGALFGSMTTRGLVRRLRLLIKATGHVAEGNYTQRVSILRKDEIGDLERQFNRMAEQLEESIAQQQRLTEQNARLAERERISRELHDAISQDLFSLHMLAGGLEQAVARGSNLQPYIETLEQATNGMLHDMRALLLELRPVQLEKLGLVRALEELATTYSMRLGISVSASIQAISLHEKVQHTLFRITQEALTNAVRHADATKITITLRSSQDQLEFVIVDNGKGFEQTEEKRAYGLGLGLMQERIQELGGTLSIHSTFGEGTQITISLSQEYIL